MFSNLLGVWMFLKNVIGVFCDSNLNLLFSATDKTKKGAQSGTNKQTRDEQVRPRSGKFDFDSILTKKSSIRTHAKGSVGKIQRPIWHCSMFILTSSQLNSVQTEQFTVQSGLRSKVAKGVRKKTARAKAAPGEFLISIQANPPRVSKKAQA